ncbi:MAG: aldo/keto reductase [Candidatus Pacebacteria bacterium]|nr:aldo/keto reductase [Candidatus Paceibacterota bacterium]
MDYLQPDPSLYNVPFTVDEFNGMPYRLLGRSGLRVSNVGLGTWKMGFPETGDGARVDEKTAYRIFDRAIELGVTFWDTANRYNGASGNSERLIGRWLKNNPDQRRNVVIATKCFGGMDGRTPNHSRLSRTNILESVYASLERLQVDYLDLLYFHRFDEETPMEESLCAIEDLVAQDTVRYFGVSNFTVEQLQQYASLQREASCRCRVTAVQNYFELLNGEKPECAGVLEYCATQDPAFVAYSPLAGGLLTDRYLEPSKASKGDRLVDEGRLSEAAPPEVVRKLRKLNEVADKGNLSLSQMCLCYMLSMPGMGPVIPSASTVEQLESNAEAGKIQLQDEQKTAIRTFLAG